MYTRTNFLTTIPHQVHPMRASDSVSGVHALQGGLQRNREEGDATAFIYSPAHGWCACGSVGLGAVAKTEWYESKGDVTLQATWSTEELGGEADSVFLVSAPRGGCLCVFVCGGNVHVFSKNRGGLARAAAPIPAIAAAPLVDMSALESLTCLAILAAPGKLSVMFGTYPLCEVSLSVSSPKRLSQALGTRLSVCSDGNKCLTRIEMCAVSSLLTRRALGQVYNNMCLPAYLRVKRTLLEQVSSLPYLRAYACM
jgi:hypothetical protein